MSSQITVWALWIVALRVARCSLKWVDVWRLHCIGLFLASSTRLPTHPHSLLSLPLTFLYSWLLQSGSIMEAGCVVAAVIENAASGPQSEPGSSDVLEGWVTRFLLFKPIKICNVCVCVWVLHACMFIQTCVCILMRCLMNKSISGVIVEMTLFSEWDREGTCSCLKLHQIQNSLYVLWIYIASM